MLKGITWANLKNGLEIANHSKPTQQTGGGINWFWILTGALSVVGGFQLGGIIGALSLLSKGVKVGLLVGLMLPTLVSVAWSAKTFVLNFNWNVTDEALDNAIKAREVAWYGQLGATLGAALGWGACGLLPGYGLTLISKELAYKVLIDVGEEAFDAVVDELNSLAQIGLQNQMRDWSSRFFMNLRWLLNNTASGENTGNALQPLIQLMYRIFPKVKEWAKHIGGGGNNPWILSREIEEWIEDLPIGDKWKELFEELLEEFDNNCREALIVWSNSIRDYSVAQIEALNQQNSGGDAAITIFQPNRAIPDISATLYGTDSQKALQAVQYMQNYQLLQNFALTRSLDVESSLTYAEQMIFDCNVILYWKNKPTPGNSRREKIVKNQLTIRGVDINKLKNFDKLKRAMGYVPSETGSNLLSSPATSNCWYGNFFATASFKGQKPYVLWRRSRDEAIKSLWDILEYLIDPITFKSYSGLDFKKEVVAMNVTELIIDNFSRNETKELIKPIVQLFPYEMDVIYKKKIFSDADKTLKVGEKATKQGIFYSQEINMRLWHETEPDTWSETLDSLVSTVTTYA